MAVKALHNLDIIHSDIKPENIVMADVSSCCVKLIDFGSSCFCHDFLGEYVQSRSYRAPEVILGMGYDFKVDVRAPRGLSSLVLTVPTQLFSDLECRLRAC